MRKIIQILISLALLGGTVIGGLLWVWPRYQELANTQNLIKEYQNRLEQGGESLEDLLQVRAQVQAREEEFAKIPIAIPADPKVPALFDHVQQIASSSGMVLGSIAETGAEQPEGGGITKLGLNLQLVGTYDSLKNFLDTLRRSTRIINVEYTQIQAGSGEQGSVLSVNMQLTAYAR